MGNILTDKLDSYLESFTQFKDKRHRRVFKETVAGILSSQSLFPPQDRTANCARTYFSFLRG